MSNNGTNKGSLLAKIRMFFMKRNELERVSVCKLIGALLILCVIIVLVVMFQQKKMVAGYITGFILQFPIGFFLLAILMPISMNENTKGSKGGIVIAIATNMLFLLSPTLFLYTPETLNEMSFKILNPVFLLIMFFCIYKCKCVEIKKGEDLSLLKGANYIVAYIFLIIIFFPTYNINNSCMINSLEIIKQKIQFYYIAPLTLLQGLYELLDRKSKQKN